MRKRLLLGLLFFISISRVCLGAYVCSSTAMDGKCDYRCSGVDDLPQIQAALDAHVDVELSTGTFWVSGSPTMKFYGQTLKGQGYSTLIKNLPGVNAPCLTGEDLLGITVSGIRFDGDKDNQTSAFSTVDFENLQSSKIKDVWVTGGLRTGTYPSVSSDGEGLVLRNSNYNTLNNIHAYDNIYDGIKLRNSDHNSVTNIYCANNGRACIQISFIHGETDGADYNTFTNINAFHLTGIPSDASPVTSGFYIHGGIGNTINGLQVYGTRQGIGLIEAYRNEFDGGTLYTRGYQNSAVIDMDSLECDSNKFSNFVTYALSGDAQRFVTIPAGCDWNTFDNIQFNRGAGTGYWTAADLGSGNEFRNCKFTSSTQFTKSSSGKYFNNQNLDDNNPYEDDDDITGVHDVHITNDLFVDGMAHLAGINWDILEYPGSVAVNWEDIPNYSNGKILTALTNGNVNWDTTPASGAGGNNTEFQWNNGGVLDGADNLIYSGGIVHFNNFPTTPSSEPSTDYEVANKKYVDDNSGGGGPEDAGIALVLDGNGSAISAGTQVDVVIPYDCIIEGWIMVADQTGSIQIDVWKDIYANFPPTSGDSIAGSEKPAISSSDKGYDDDLTTWTTAVSKGDVIRFNADSVSAIERINLLLQVEKE